MDLKLGSFELVKPLGRGGMGEVWLARHDREQVDVAVKLITATRARKDRYHTAFRAEVQAMAKLHHRAIALVLDYGRVDARAARASEGQFEADSPYLAMELADGSLDRFTRHLQSWEDVRDVLMQTLDGLAHAHARGLIHRDIKPQNILVTHGDTPAYKLADFGLARTLEDDAGERAAAGTPKYMAPEQIMGDVREQGPWTDLYALGCVAHWLVNGQPPYAFEESEDVFRGHLMEPLPPLSPKMRVPAQFEKWLRLMLAKETRARFRGAADARWALEQVDDERWVGALGSARSVDGEDGLDPTVVDGVDSTIPVDTGATTRPDVMAGTGIPAGLDEPTTHPLAPPMSDHWRRPSHPLASMRLVGAGLGLYGLRPIPMVDRDVERDAIWDALREVHEAGGVRTVILEGAAGTGKSRIAEWMSERAQETGAARVFRAGHGPIEGAADGLGRMVSRAARVVGAGRTEVLDRMQKWMSPDGRGLEFDGYDVFALADITQGAGPWLENATPEERYGVIERFLRFAAPDRPVLVWLDDAQWGAESLAFARFVQESDDPPDLLFLVTVRSEALVERPVERTALHRLGESEGVRRLKVEPLAQRDQQELVARMLRLDADLARRVVKRTEGNPLFAVQLVGDWVERGLLTVGEDGFEVAEPDGLELPDSIRNVWSRRVERAVRRYVGSTTISGSGVEPDVALQSLELAAALGQEVDYTEWMVACAESDIDASLRLIEELVGLRLASRTPTGWRFGHGMLRESLELRARRVGRHAENHAACARMLRRQLGTQEGAARIAEHLLAAERWEEALGPLIVAAEQTARRGEFEAAIRLDQRRDDVMDEIGLPEHDPRRIIGSMRRTRTLMMLSRYDEAEKRLQAATASLDPDSPDEVVAEVRWAQAGYARHRNRTSDGLDYAHQALEAYQRIDDTLGVVRCHKRIGELHRRAGRLEESIESYREAEALLHDLDAPFDHAWTLLGLGTTERHATRFDAAQTHIEAARDVFDEIGNRLGLGNSFNELGELVRAQGRHREAERYYERALALWERRGHTDLAVLRYNLGLARLSGGRHPQAEPQFHAVLKEAEERGRRALAMFCNLGLACSRASSGAWEEAEAYYDAFAETHDAIDLVEPDVAELSELLGTVATEERPALARDALERALRQYERVGNDERARHVTDMMDRLTS